MTQMSNDDIVADLTRTHANEMLSQNEKEESIYDYFF
jgi:hypothetical protein